MVTVVVVIHVVVCISLCIIVLMQRGKGAEVGAVFGGSSQTVFGASGAGGALRFGDSSESCIFSTFGPWQVGVAIRESKL